MVGKHLGIFMVGKVIKRNGDVVDFDIKKIQNAIFKALIHSGYDGDAVERSMFISASIPILAGVSVKKISVDELHNIVENALMDEKEFAAAKAYVLYREKRDVERKEKELGFPVSGYIDEVCREYSLEINKTILLKEVYKNTYPGASHDEIKKAILMSARCFIEKDVLFNRFCAALLEWQIFGELHDNVIGGFRAYINRGVSDGILIPDMLTFNIDDMAKMFDRKINFDYIGIQTLYDRYLLRDKNGKLFEAPEYMFMRISMGLALNEKDKNQKAIEFYKVLSSFDFMSSTPTLFNAGTTHPQLSSCYLSTVDDSLKGIFESLGDNAMLSKHAGGLGIDYTPVRSIGSSIKGTNGKSQGIIPFLKIVNDMVIAVNQGGKRKGSACVYLETWHLDIEEFLELRKNTGDDRRRTHDMNTANWIPDLFMKRQMADREWTLFSPDECPDLHDLYGKKFESAYEKYEEKAKNGEIKNFKVVSAKKLWQKMMTMLFETGHPWITFKDACNVRSPQQHVGVVHSSNLCCITADQRVVSDRGMLTIKELFDLGGKNKVFGINGVNKASEMFLPRPNAPIVKIHTKQGYTHKVTPDHKVWVDGIGWTEAQNLKTGDKLLIQQSEGIFGNSSFEDEAFIMGLVAGDGNITERSVNVDIWKDEFCFIKEIEEKVNNIINKHFPEKENKDARFVISEKYGRARLTSSSLLFILNKYGFNRETKLSIPKKLWEADKKTISSYLSGLYFADSTIQASGDITTLSLSSINLKLLEDLQIIWANFGVKSSLSKMRDLSKRMLPDGKGGKKEYECLPIYRLLITSIQGCKIAESVTNISKYRCNSRFFLEKIKKDGYSQKMFAEFSYLEKMPNEDAYCLTVDSDMHDWTVNGLITKNTEITLNTSEDEIAVCNLGSVNLKNHLTKNSDGNVILDMTKLEKTISTAMRMLDNVIDINYYPVDKAKKSNMRHRPVGLGMMGFQDCLYEMRIPYDSQEAVEFADTSTEAVCYFAYLASSNLAKERGTYKTYDGSLWSKGILPQDTINILSEHRGGWVNCDKSETIGWSNVIDSIKEHGMRNSNCVAIAPTATISNITGVSASIEPTYQNLYVKSNLSGEFTIINEYLIKDLEKLGILDDLMIMEIKKNDGSIQNIDRIPDDLKRLYKTAFEIDPTWLIECAARRQKWIDQAQSLNIYMTGASGKKMSAMYELAWMRGLKTTYYFRSLGATSAEKSTINTGALNQVNVCSLENKNDCEACQ